jgi:putative transposase
MRKTFKYRLYPNKAQTEALRGQLYEACRWYNAALQERREAYRTHRLSLNYYTQANQLKEIRDAGDLGLVNYHCAQDVLKRLDKAFKAFFRRIKHGQKPGFPRFKSSRRFDSITFPSHGDGNKLLERHLRIRGVGNVKIKLHRPLKGNIKTVTVKRECAAWYVCFSVECGTEPLPETNEQVGIDVGLTTFGTLAPTLYLKDIEEIPNPRFQKKAERALRIAQRRLSRRPHKRSNGRRKAVMLLKKVHQRIFNQRNNFLHEESRKIVDRFGVIYVEDLNFKGLAAGMLCKAVHDASWSSFITKIAYKAESAGRKLIQVDPRGTSQRCPCGASVPKKLSDREHVCTECGLVGERDQVSAMEILRLGTSLHDASTVQLAVLS